MPSQPPASTEVKLSNMKFVLSKETTDEQNNKSTPTQTKITQANVAKTAVLSQNNRVIKVVLLSNSKIDQVWRNASMYILESISSVNNKRQNFTSFNHHQGYALIFSETFRSLGNIKSRL